MAKKFKTYSDKLRDPRWQKKRLEVMQRDEFTCQWCWDKETTLNVHHLEYSGRNPWEVSSDYLITICENCHLIEHKERAGAEECLIESFKSDGFSLREIYFLSMDTELKKIIRDKYKKTYLGWRAENG